MKAMILAAGLGARLRPLTDSKPKALVEINGVTLLELTLNRLKSFGIRQIIINVHHFSDQIIEFLKRQQNFGLDLQISVEKELLDTGGGLKKAGWFFTGDEPFILHNVDLLTDLNLTELIDTHLNSDALVTLAVRKRKSNRYFLSDKDNNLCGWESIIPPEKKLVRPAKSQLRQVSFMGIHIISPGLFGLMPDTHRFSIIDVYLQNAAGNEIKTIQCDQYRWMDLGKTEQLRKAPNLFPDLLR